MLTTLTAASLKPAEYVGVKEGQREEGERRL